MKLFLNVCMACSVECARRVWGGTNWNLVLLFAVKSFNYTDASFSLSKINVLDATPDLSSCCNSFPCFG